MPKIKNNIVIFAEEDSEEWWDFEHDRDQRDWSNWDQHPWSWYMELSIRRDEGWHHIKINRNYKYQTVVNWLKEQGAVYRHSLDEFLIEDSKVATMVALQWG